ncbi:MFS transporter, partial [Nocardioides hankookensis]
AVLLLVEEPAQRSGGAIDWYGMVLLATGLVALVLPLSQASSWGWGSARVLGLLVASALLLGLLVVLALGVVSPLVDMRTLGRPPILITNVASIFFGFALFASFVGTATYVQMPEATGYGFGASVLVAGLCLLPSGILMLLLAPVTARLSVAWGAARVLSLAVLILVVGLVFRIVFVDALWQVVVGTAIIGAGTGIGYATLPTLINSHAPAAELAAANGINTLARSLGSTLASAIGGTLLASITMDLGGVAVPSLAAFRVLFAICAGAALV